MHYKLSERIVTSLPRASAAVMQSSCRTNTGIEITEKSSKTSADYVTSNVDMVTSNNAETSRVDCQPAGVSMPKKRGRKPKIHRFPRLLNVQKVQQSVPVQVPSTPLPIASSDNSEPTVIKRKRGRPRKYNIEPPKPPPVAEPEVKSQETGHQVISENCIDNVNKVIDRLKTNLTDQPTDQPTLAENCASIVNNVIDHVTSNETGPQSTCGDGISTVSTMNGVSDHMTLNVVEHQIMGAEDRVDNVSDVVDQVSTMATEDQIISENCVSSVSDDNEYVTANVRNIDDVTEREPATANSDTVLTVTNRSGRKRKSTTDGDADEDETEKRSSEDSGQMLWKVTSPEGNRNDILPRIKMTSVRLSRDKSAAAKWLVRPTRDSRQGRKRPAATSGGRKQSIEGHPDQGQGRRVQGQNDGRPDIHLMQNASNWMPSSLCSAVASWNAAALASVRMRNSNDSIGGSHVSPMTSHQQAAAFNGMTGLQDFSSMFNYTNMSPSGVTINDVGSEVMFVVGSDRRLSAVPMKIGDMLQFDQSNGGGLGDAGLLLQQSRTLDGGVTGTGRVATVRPLEHAKIASQILAQRVLA